MHFYGDYMWHMFSFFWEKFGGCNRGNYIFYGYYMSCHVFISVYFVLCIFYGDYMWHVFSFLKNGCNALKSQIPKRVNMSVYFCPCNSLRIYLCFIWHKEHHVVWQLIFVFVWCFCFCMQHFWRLHRVCSLML